MFVARLYLGLDIKFKPNLVAAADRHKFDRLICALNSGLNLIHLNFATEFNELKPTRKFALKNRVKFTRRHLFRVARMPASF